MMWMIGARQLRSFVAVVVAAAACIVCLQVSGSGQAAAFPPNADGALDALVEQGLKDWQVPGLAIAVVKDGKVVLAKGYGVRSLTKREPVTDDTLFYIASATKSFTATLAAMMVEEGTAQEGQRCCTANSPARASSVPSTVETKA